MIYKSPDNEAGYFEPTHLIESIQLQHQYSHEPSESSIDDEQQKLLDVEQNIANLEQNLKIKHQQSCKGESFIDIRRACAVFCGRWYVMIMLSALEYSS